MNCLPLSAKPINFRIEFWLTFLNMWLLNFLNSSIVVSVGLCKMELCSKKIAAFMYNNVGQDLCLFIYWSWKFLEIVNILTNASKLQFWLFIVTCFQVLLFPIWCSTQINAFLSPRILSSNFHNLNTFMSY